MARRASNASRSCFRLVSALALALGGGCAFAWPNKPLGHSYSNIRPSVRSKQALIANLRDPDCKASKARWSIELMKARKLFITTWEYVCAMKKMAQVKCPKEAIELWKEMRGRGLEETPATYTAAIVAYNTWGHWRKAVETLDEMQSKQMAPLRIGAEHALMACEQGALWEKALNLLDQLWEYGIVPNEDNYMPAIRACENAGQFEKGDELFWKMREHTKLVKAAEDLGMDPERTPPKAKEALWRIPGAVDPRAFDPPNFTAEAERRARKKKKPRKMPQLPAGRPKVWG
ncbi:unnamed protein product [Effrenium voratum]|uniref:Pentacotripeptide-repeat region of PRORP domain-containing protein n=1 Tax=Effrenium voratum TaxID=2562239 RepID=A0AA36IBR0_9DINO|nr:unnamed protein product [Effrenium voratum]CAJ1462136.1 unnamed protein product [Effrenium voratum]